MMSYRYAARSHAGILVSGTVRAACEADVVATLRSRRLFVTSVYASDDVRGRIAGLGDRLSSRRAARTAAMRALAILVSSGASLLRALDVAMEQCGDRRFAESLQAVSDDVSGGGSFSEAMSRRTADFPESIVAMVRAGEAGGILDDALERAATLLESYETMRRQVVTALAYPIFVLLSACGLLLFLLVGTIPEFSSILEQLHADVPMPTRALIVTSAVVRNPWVVAAGVVAAALLYSGGTIASRMAPVSSWLDRVLLDAPLIGALRRQTNTAAFARTTGTLLQCGLSVTAALDASRGVLGSSTYRNAVSVARALVEDGVTLSTALGKSDLFGRLCVQMAAVGEESGALDTALVRVAEHLEDEVAHGVKGVASVLEPLLILVLGGVVAGVVASIIVPLYAAIGNIR